MKVGIVCAVDAQAVHSFFFGYGFLRCEYAVFDIAGVEVVQPGEQDLFEEDR